MPNGTKPIAHVLPRRTAHEDRHGVAVLRRPSIGAVAEERSAPGEPFGNPCLIFGVAEAKSMNV